MIRMRKTQLLIFFACFSGLAGFSQSSKGIVTGNLTDSSGKRPVSLATVAVYYLADSSLVTYRLSDPAGTFRVPGLPLNDSLRVIITHVGAGTFRKNILIPESNPEFDFDTIQINPSAQTLDEVVVMAEAPPILVKNDTIEFNASSFKTLPSALVEDLLRKLPGVDIDGDGSILVNGRKVTKLYVDGKEFFGSDPQMATKNLPANIIDKVQVTDDKEQLLMDPDLPKGQVGQVINLTLKKAIKKGWFGKAYAGAGTDDRYEAGGIFNLFRDTLQVSLLGYTNNLNKPGFGMNDVMNMGGFNRSGTNSIMVRSDGGFALNDISFGGTGNGIQRSTGAGINLNNQLRKNLTLNFQYFYGQIKSDVIGLTDTRQFFGDTTMSVRNGSNATNGNYSHRFGGYIKWNIDSLSNFEFRPSLTLTDIRNYQMQKYTTENNFQGLINESDNNQRDNNNGTDFSQFVSYSKSFRKKGRTLYASVNLQLTANNNDRENLATNTFYDHQQSSEALLSQLRRETLDNHSFSLNVNYNEPLSKMITLRMGEAFNSFNNKDNIGTFLDENNDRKYVIANPALTDGFKRSGFKNTSRLSLKYTRKKWSIAPGVSYQILNIENAFEKAAPIPQKFSYLLPSLVINAGSWNMSYSATANEPPIAALQPVQNNSNPLYIQKGNPDLTPSVSHNLNISNFNYNTRNNINYNVSFFGALQDNNIIYARAIDESGVQTTTPVNGNGSGYAQIYGSISKQMKFSSDWKFSAGARFWTVFNRQQIMLNDIESQSNNWSMTPGVNFSFNWKDIFEFRENFNFSWSKSFYSDKIFPSLQSTTYRPSSEVIIRAPKHWVWESSVDYFVNSGVSRGFQKNVVRWNAAVNYVFLKDDRAQLKLMVFDLLNQNKQIYTEVSSNYIRDVQTNVLSRYLMLTFTYNFRQFGGKVGGKERFFLF